MELLLEAWGGELALGECFQQKRWSLFALTSLEGLPPTTLRKENVSTGHGRRPLVPQIIKLHQIQSPWGVLECLGGLPT